MRIVALVLTGLVAGVALAGGGDEANKKALEQMQGTWQLVKGVKDGQPAPMPEQKSVEIKGNKVTVHEGGKEQRASFKLDASKKPTAMDITTATGELVLAIVVVEGDTMKLAMCGPGSVRPTAFASAPDSDSMYMEFRRVKK